MSGVGSGPRGAGMNEVASGWRRRGGGEGGGWE